MTPEPNTIPDEIMKAAREAYDASPVKVTGTFEACALIMVIAEAIHDGVMAERERCASIIEGYASGRTVAGNAVKPRNMPSQTSVLMAQLIRDEV